MTRTGAWLRIVAAVIVAWLLFVWLALGPILRWAVPKYLERHGGYALSIDRIRINPLQLKLEVDGARLAEPDGTALAGFGQLLVDFESASIWRRAWTFREVSLVEPSARLALAADGSLNWQAFLAQFASAEPPPPRSEGLPPLRIEQVVIEKAAIDFSDEHFARGFATRIDPLDLELSDLSTLPGEESAWRLALASDIGARLQTEGRLALDPLAVTADASLSDVLFERLWPYLEGRLSMAPPQGEGEMQLRARVATEGQAVQVEADGLELRIRDLALRGPQQDEPALQLGTVTLSAGKADTRTRKVQVGAIELAGGHLALQRDRHGAIDLASWFAAPNGEQEGNSGESGTASSAEAPASVPAAEAPAAAAGNAGEPASVDERSSAAGKDAATEAQAGAGTDAGADMDTDAGSGTQAGAQERAGATSEGDAWSFGLDKLAIDGLALRYADASLAQPLDASVGDLQLALGAHGSLGDALELELEKLGVRIGDIRLASAGLEQPITVAGLVLEGGALDLAGQEISVDTLRIERPRLALAREADGTLTIIAAMRAAEPARAPGAAVARESASSPAWHYRIGTVALAEGEVELQDRSVRPTARLGVRKIAASVRELSDDLQQKWPVEAGFELQEGGRFAASGTLVAGKPAGEFALRADEIALAPAQPWLGQFARLRIAGGKLSSKGRLHFDGDRFGYQGEAAVAGLDLREAPEGGAVLAWRALATDELAVAADRVEIGELRLDGLRTEVKILKDHSLNMARLLVSDDKPAASPAPAKPAESARASAEPAFRFDIKRLRLSKGDVDFADESLLLPFAAHIHDLAGDLAGLSNKPGSAASLALKGKVDEYGSAQVDGEVNLFDPTAKTDATVKFRNVEMVNLTPYTATFAGRRIASGKLALDLAYQIEHGKLLGDNRIVMDELTLGEKVESADAPDLPLDLAVAILKDSSGRIDLGLPVSGSFEDPEFSIGGLVGKALLGLVTKIVTAPFRALGALLGAGDDADLSRIAFDAGRAELPGSEREKLTRVAKALAERPGLALAVTPGYAPDADGAALRDVALRRQVAARLGRKVQADEDPGPLAMSDEDTRSSLEALFVARFGKEALADLRARAAAEAQAPSPADDAADGSDPERAQSARRAAPAAPQLAPAQARAAADTRLYRDLFERLRAAEPLEDAALQALGQQRGDAIRRELQAAGLADARVEVAGASEQEAEDDGSVPSSLDLEAGS